MCSAAAPEVWAFWAAISVASVLGANWLDALEVCAVVAAGVEFAVPPGRFCPVRIDAAPWAAPTTACRPESAERAEMIGIVTA